MKQLVEAEMIAEKTRQIIKGLTDVTEIYFHCKNLEIEFLNLPVWKASFATGDEEFAKSSSVYFISQSGAAIRIKYANLFNPEWYPKEIGKIILDIQEKCYFTDYAKTKTEKPIIGLTVEEVSTKDFCTAIENKQYTYNHNLFKYQGNDVFFIEQLENTKVYKHGGHEVSKVFWERY